MSVHKVRWHLWPVTLFFVFQNVMCVLQDFLIKSKKLRLKSQIIKIQQCVILAHDVIPKESSSEESEASSVSGEDEEEEEETVRTPRGKRGTPRAGQDNNVRVRVTQTLFRQLNLHITLPVVMPCMQARTLHKNIRTHTHARTHTHTLFMLAVYDDIHSLQFQTPRGGIQYAHWTDCVKGKNVSRNKEKPERKQIESQSSRAVPD